MKPRSGKSKARRLQNKIREMLLCEFPELESEDVKCALMSEGGEDIKLSSAARKIIPLSIEAKNRESLNIWDALEQAEKNSSGNIPAVVFKRNRSKTYVALEFDQLLKLLKQSGT